MALGIMPYISASIVIQLLGVAVPYIQKLQREGESGRTKINQIETQLDVLIDDAKVAKQQVIVANEDFIQLSNSMAVNDKILKNLNTEIKGAVKEIKEVKNMTELQNRKLYISE